MNPIDQVRLLKKGSISTFYSKRRILHQTFETQMKIFHENYCLHVFHITIISNIFITRIQLMFVNFKSECSNISAKIYNKRSSAKCEMLFKLPIIYFSDTQGLWPIWQCIFLFKHHTKMKGLIAVSPKGAACFMSDLVDICKHFRIVFAFKLG